MNRVPCDSIDRWEGEIHDDAEEILLAKTTDERYEVLCEYVVERHPYEVPRAERFDEDDELDAFAEWREESTLAGDVSG